MSDFKFEIAQLEYPLNTFYVLIFVETMRSGYFLKSLEIHKVSSLDLIYPLETTIRYELNVTKQKFELWRMIGF